MVNIMDMGITKMSSKGQIVIPADMRKDMKEGDKFIVIKDEEKILLRKMTKMDKKLEEDLEFAKRTNKALDDYEAGRGNWVEMDGEDFLKEIKKW